MASLEPRQAVDARRKTPDLEDDVANRGPGLLWDRQDAGVVNETRNSSDAVTHERRLLPERRADRSDTATYHAMNSRLKLLAHELHAAGRRLAFDIAVANADKNSDKSRVDATSARLVARTRHLDDMAREIAKQLGELNTTMGDSRLAEGGQILAAALDDFQPVMREVDAWMAAHDRYSDYAWEVIGRGNAILKLIFPGSALFAKPTHNLEQPAVLIEYDSINAQLDAAIAAAESAESGNRHHANRVIMHAKSLAELLGGHSGTERTWGARIKKFIGIVDRILVDNPYLKRSFDEALLPIRHIK